MYMCMVVHTNHAKNFLFDNENSFLRKDIFDFQYFKSLHWRARLYCSYLNTCTCSFIFSALTCLLFPPASSTRVQTTCLQQPTRISSRKLQPRPYIFTILRVLILISDCSLELMLSDRSYCDILNIQEEEDICGSHGNMPPSSAPRLENPYDTMFVENTSAATAAAVTSQRHHQPSQPQQFSEPGVYCDPGEVTGEIPS